MHIRDATGNPHFDPSESAYLAAATALGLSVPDEAAVGVTQNWALLAQHYRTVSDALTAEDAA